MQQRYRLEEGSGICGLGGGYCGSVVCEGEDACVELQNAVLMMEMEIGREMRRGEWGNCISFDGARSLGKVRSLGEGTAFLRRSACLDGTPIIEIIWAIEVVAAKWKQHISEGRDLPKRRSTSIILLDVWHVSAKSGCCSTCSTFKEPVLHQNLLEKRLEKRVDGGKFQVYQSKECLN